MNLDGVRAFLLERGQRVRGRLTAEPLTGGRSNLTYRLDDGVSAWVLRMPPAAGRLASAHDIAREVAVTRALEPTGFPVPPVVGLCTDERVLEVPFSVVAFVPGRTVRNASGLAGWDDGTLDRCVEALLTTLAALHAVDVAAVGLEPMRRPGGFAERQLRRWSSQWEVVGAGSASDADARAIAARLADRLPAAGSVSVVHGDFRIDNVILDPDDPGRVRAVVDWELATVGDPVADVAVTCAYRHSALDAMLGTTAAAWSSDRLPHAAELAGRYEARSGRALEHWEFHLALAYYKLAAIAAGIVHRHRSASATGPEPAVDAVPAYLAAAREALR